MGTPSRISTICLIGTLLLSQGALAQTAEIRAVAETDPVGKVGQDSADDPAIWFNPAVPEKSLIIGTDKKAGLHVFGLDGKRRQFVPDGRINNVDLVDMGDGGVIVVASDRNDKSNAALRVYRLQTESATLHLLGVVPVGKGEGYGLCLFRTSSNLYAFSVLKNGPVLQTRIDLSAAEVSGATVRTLQIAHKSEGCVADPRTNTLYVGEQDHGIWAFDARPEGGPNGRMVAPVDHKQLDDDVEGLTIAPIGGDGGWFIGSSQGDNTFAVYKLPDFEPHGRFRIVAGTVGGTEHTDGIALVTANFGTDYPDGLFVAQDGKNRPNPQNFKYVSWRDVLDGLGLSN